jgi:hypothetical protein
MRREKMLVRGFVAGCALAAVALGVVGCGAMSCRVRPPASVGVPVRLTSPPPGYRLAVTVEDARVERGRLAVDVRFEGACTVSDVALFAGGVFADEEPAACDVVVAASGESGCVDIRTESFVFDLGPLTTKLLGERPDARSLVLRVGPASGETPVTVSTYRLR